MGIDSITEPKDIRHSGSDKSVDATRDCRLGIQSEGIVLAKPPPPPPNEQHFVLEKALG